MTHSCLLVQLHGERNHRTRQALRVGGPLVHLLFHRPTRSLWTSQWPSGGPRPHTVGAEAGARVVRIGGKLGLNGQQRATLRYKIIYLEPI